jgi:hypothetical protein
MNKIDPIQDLQEIRKMMEGSTKFISLSGLSGVFAGLTALVGAAGGYLLVQKFFKLQEHYFFSGRFSEEVEALKIKLFTIAIAVLALALGFGVLFTYLKAKKQNLKLVSAVSFRLVRSLMVPLFFGGIFTLGLIYQEAYVMIAPVTLIFYGMSLLNASKYVQVELKYLALCQMALGTISVFFFAAQIQFLMWALGFGVLHIIYGGLMWWKYDRKQTA